MNIALQKRNEQLERWRQNEADERSINENDKNLSSTDISDKSGDIGQNSKIDLTQQYSLSSSSTNKKGGSRKRSSLQVKFDSSTLFLTACANNDIDECERLLTDKSIDINATTTDGLTGLHEAAIFGHSDMVEFLLKNGANINCTDNEGWTPLHAASSLGQMKVVQQLLDSGADATIVNCENFLAYDLARNEEVKELIEKHLDGIDIDFLHRQEERAIQTDIEKWIQTGKFEDRSHPITKATVLHVIAAKGYTNLMKQILSSPQLKKQVDLEAKDNEGFTPLLAASFWDQQEIVEMLIEHGANIFAQANNGYKVRSIHLKNYQHNKTQEFEARKASVPSRTSVDDKIASKGLSNLSLDSSDLTYDDSESSGVGGYQPKYGLSKSHSLDISQHQQQPSDTSYLYNSMSVDRLLLRSESMTERELRKSFKELAMEYDCLKKQLRGLDDRDKQRQQEWLRKERQMQRKISELEEENKQLEQWRQEIRRLKEENTSLLRVVNKLSKQS